MYNNKLYEDYDFLRKHCSSGLLKKLQDSHPYDTDGIAYATWLFRSSQQDSKPGADDKTIMLEVRAVGDWFVYTALDMGWEFTNRIKITSKGGRDRDRRCLHDQRVVHKRIVKLEILYWKSF